MGRPPRPPPYISFIHVLLLIPIVALIRLALGIFVRSALRFFLRQNNLLLVLPVIGVGIGLVFLGLALLLPHFQPEVRPAAGNTGQHQLGAYTNCNHGCGLAVLHPVYYRHIFQEGLPKFVKFAQNIWGIQREGKTDAELALAGIDALAAFIREIGLPTTLKELGAGKDQLRPIADSCGISQGSYKKMTHEEIYKIFCECYE